MPPVVTFSSDIGLARAADLEKLRPLAAQIDAVMESMVPSHSRFCLRASDPPCCTYCRSSCRFACLRLRFRGFAWPQEDLEKEIQSPALQGIVELLATADLVRAKVRFSAAAPIHRSRCLGVPSPC